MQEMSQLPLLHANAFFPCNSHRCRLCTANISFPKLWRVQHDLLIAHIMPATWLAPSSSPHLQRHPHALQKLITCIFGRKTSGPCKIHHWGDSQSDLDSSGYWSTSKIECIDRNTASLLSWSKQVSTLKIGLQLSLKMKEISASPQESHWSLSQKCYKIHYRCQGQNSEGALIEQAALTELCRKTCRLPAAPWTSHWSYIWLTRATHSHEKEGKAFPNLHIKNNGSVLIFHPIVELCLKHSNQYHVCDEIFTLNTKPIC